MPTSWESFVYSAIIVEARYHKGMNKGKGSSWGEGEGYHTELPKLVATAAAKKVNVLDKCDLLVYNKAIHPLIHGPSARWCPMSPHLLTR